MPLWNDVEFPLIFVFVFIIVIVIAILIFKLIWTRRYYIKDFLKGNFKPFSGLKNTSEKCYMNAMIQALASSEDLIQKYNILVVDVQDSKLKILVELLIGINQPGEEGRLLRGNSEKLQELVTCVQWNKESQQDAFQMLSFFINDIQRGIEKHLEAKKMTMPPKFQLLHSFSENKEFNKLQDHLALAIPLVGQFREKPGVSLESLLNAFFAPSVIDDGPNTTSMSLYDKEPDVLILHIQANEWSPNLERYVKPEYYIKYNETLEYEFMIQEHSDGSKMVPKMVKYQLTAVVHHMGEVSGGHYITYRRHKGLWYLTNDEQVEGIDFKCHIIPYIMIYEKL